MIVNEISLVIQNIISFFQSLFLIFNPEIKTEILLETFTSRKTIYHFLVSGLSVIHFPVAISGGSF